MRQIRIEPDFESWRDLARGLLATQTPPGDVMFVEAGLENALLPGFVDAAPPRAASLSTQSPRVPREFVSLAGTCACHRDPERWSILYRVLWRLTHGGPHLLKVAVDDDVHRLLMMEKQVRFDSHKMKAFVRFRRVVEEDGAEHYIAWHRSEHRVLKLTAPFFARRFGLMKWSILTPLDSACWDGRNLTFGPGVDRSGAPQGDALEEMWRTYYASIFNPARIKLGAMRKEMPRRYWSTMPETQLIPDLLFEAPRRAKEMVERHGKRLDGAAAFLPKTLSLPQLREAATSCRGCDLCEIATQTVFGEGPETASVVFVGEQPGDQEDRSGRPFVGPAGQVFDEALATAGLRREEMYVTNAVKHFRFEIRGKKRIHQRASSRQIDACRPWVEAELRTIRPGILVLLGSTAAQSLVGRHFRITRDRGRPFETQWSRWTIATYHPSALLRIPDPQLLAQSRAEFTADLFQVAQRLTALRGEIAA